jgi:hypothetical protein
MRTVTTSETTYDENGRVIRQVVTVDEVVNGGVGGSGYPYYPAYPYGPTVTYTSGGCGGAVY